MDFIRPAITVGFADVFQRDLVELLAIRRRITAGDAGLAELVGGFVNGAGDRFDRQVAERVRAEDLAISASTSADIGRPRRIRGANSSSTVDMSMP